VNSKGAAADESTLAKDMKSLYDSLYEQHGPLHMDQVSMFFGPNHTSPDYNTALNVLRSSKHTCEAVELGALDGIGGPSLYDLLMDDHLVPNISRPGVIFRFGDQPNGFGTSHEQSQSPGRETSEIDPRDLPPSSAVTMQMWTHRLPAAGSIATYRAKHPDRQLCFTDKKNRSLAEYDTAIEAERRVLTQRSEAGLSDTEGSNDRS
jgi:hypothetical protein